MPKYNPLQGMGGGSGTGGRSIAGKASGAKAKMVSTGKAKKLAEESKKFDAPVKGSGKPKYKNTVKEARTNTKKISTNKIAGKKLTKSEAKARARKTPNLPKQIAKEDKIRTGVNTAKLATKKVPTKRNFPKD